MSNPLNPALYDRLKELYDDVLINHEGEAFDRPAYIDPITGKRMLAKVRGGEFYRINCPFCPDRKRRLYVSYMFGKMLSDGRKGNFLIHCFNADCLDDPQNLYEFTQGLEMGTKSLAALPVAKGRKAEPKVITMPGVCTPLHKLPYHHPANAYLLSRHVDGHLLSKWHGVSYCVAVTNPRFRTALHRIIVPIRDATGLIGWQGRFVGDIDFKREGVIKYFTCPDMTYSTGVLNLHIARRYHTGIMVEGWYDRFAIGPMAFPLMGHQFNDSQIGQIAVAFRHGSVVYLLDPDEFDTDKHKKLSLQLRTKLPGQVAFVRLPEGVDPDELDKSVMRPYIIQEAAKQDVVVKFGLKPKIRILEGMEA